MTDSSLGDIPRNFDGSFPGVTPMGGERPRADPVLGGVAAGGVAEDGGIKLVGVGGSDDGTLAFADSAFLAEDDEPSDAVFIKQQYSIGQIIPHIVAEEVATDELVITDHPVEMGADIADHAYRRPVEVLLKCGWSDSKVGATGFVLEVYKSLLALQLSRKPFELVTSKRNYSNMLIASLAQTTDPATGHVLLVNARLREVIIVKTLAASVPPREQQAAPQRTAPPEERGQVQPRPAPSVLSRIVPNQDT